MLVKITSVCARGCSHCMESATRAGQHMADDTFEAALTFTARAEQGAIRAGVVPNVLLSGGECTDHPRLEAYVERVLRQGWRPFLLTHGAWLADPERRRSLLRPSWSRLLVQVTHDPRFYPGEAPARVDDQRVIYVDRLTRLLPIGRARRTSVSAPWAEQPYRAPSSFNLRSITRATGSFFGAVSMLRLRSAAGAMNGQCTPSINFRGEVGVGESLECFVVGTVTSTDAELTRETLAMQCNHCGLEDNLSPAHRAAIGLR